MEQVKTNGLINPIVNSSCEPQNEQPKNIDLDTPILQFSSEPIGAAWTIRDALNGLLILGGIGSGKTSGTGRFIGLQYLANDFSGLVMCSKADEVEAWKEYAKKANRENDLCIVQPNGTEFFDIFNYLCQSNRPAGVTLTGNILQVLKTVIEGSQERSGRAGDDSFWEGALDLLITNCLELCLLHDGKITAQQLYNLAMSAPQKGITRSDENRKDSLTFVLNKVSERINKKIEIFKNKLSKAQTDLYKKDEVEYERAIFEAVPESYTLSQVHNFFMDTYYNLSDKTRSIVHFLFVGFLQSFLREPVKSLFCSGQTTFTPEACLNNKIIILNIPTKIFQKAGRDVQSMFKLIFQKAMEQRDINKNGKAIFIYADEAQEFLLPTDIDFQATARSLRIAVVYISQNLPNFYACMGGLKSEYKVKAFLGTLATKIFNANADIETNRYASDLIGEAYIVDKNWSKTISESYSKTTSESFRLEKMVRPEGFVNLQTGGPLNNFIVQGYLHRQGTCFSNGVNYKLISFSQK